MNTDKIRQHIQHIINLTPDEWLQLSPFIELKTIKKNDHFLTVGEVCNAIAFVQRGLLVYYKTQQNGDEVTTDIAFEGDWVTDNYSRLNQTPSFLNIRAIESTELLIISQPKLVELYNTLPKLERLGRILMEQAYIRIAQHSIDLQSTTAKERYLQMLQHHPEVIQKVPLHHIANYLGIAPKSLSRIRKEILIRK